LLLNIIFFCVVIWCFFFWIQQICGFGL